MTHHLNNLKYILMDEEVEESQRKFFMDSVRNDMKKRDVNDDLTSDRRMEE